MIREKINEKMIKAYLKATYDVKYKVLTYSAFAVAMGVLTSMEGQAASPNFKTAFSNLIKDAEGTITAVSTSAAVAGIGYGAFLKKFSLGKMDRIETGNKIILNCVWGWILIMGVKTLLNYFGGFLGIKAV